MADPSNNASSYGTVTLTLDDDSEITCMILSIFPVDRKQYIALLPLGDDGEPSEDAETYVYQYIDHGPDQDPELKSIEDDEEYDAVADAFDELLDEQEFNDTST